jgi:hypothetical protein
MTWFRANIRLGSRLALIALAIQFALAFGHAHHAGQPSHDVGAAHALASIPASDDHAGGEPARDPHQIACDICAVMALAGAALIAPPPALSAPPAGAKTAPAAVVGRLALAPIRGAFQARAPPLS